MATEDIYLIWSNEHQGWWGPGEHGYVQELSKAGRYARQRAIDICVNAVPQARNMLFEIPVRLADIQEMREQVDKTFPYVPRPLT